MVTCKNCGKTIDKVPAWLAGATVDFICASCAGRTSTSAHAIAESSRESLPPIDSGKDADFPEDEADEDEE